MSKIPESKANYNQERAASVDELKRQILSHLYEAVEIKSAMNLILKIVGEYFNVDRAYIFENSDDDLFCNNTFEWCNKGIEPEIDKLQNLSYKNDLGGTWLDNFDENDIFFCPSIKNLPLAQYQVLEPQHITSMLQCAIRVKGKFKGYIGFDNCSEENKGWETDKDAIDTLLYTSHLLTLFLLDYRREEKQLDIKERKFLEEQNRMRIIADEMNAAFFEWSVKDGRFYTSSAFNKYALSKISADDLFNNRGPKELVYPDDLPILEKFIKDTDTDTDRAEATLRLLMVNGEYRWCKMIGLFYRDENGKPSRVLGMIIDVNDEHENSFMLNSMINAMPCGVGIFTFADTLLCEYYSNGFAKMAGLPRKEIDKKIADNTLLRDIIAPIDYERITSEIAYLSSKRLEMNLTYRYIYGDGTIRWLHLLARKLRESNGFPVYYCVFTNPTEEIAQYGDVVENSPIGVIVVQITTNKALYANDAAALMFGFEKGHKPQNRTIEEALAEKGRRPLLTRDQISSLSADAYSEYNINQDGKYYAVQAKQIEWNSMHAYILYFTDNTSEHTMLSSIPGGVATYHIKKDGRVSTDYVSDGLAAMCGYTSDEFLDLLRYDALVNLVPDDIPGLTEKLKAALDNNGNVNAMYRIYTKAHDELMISLDASPMPATQYESDDIAAFYAVHTKVSDESKNIINREKQFHELIDSVPAGISIYEIKGGAIQRSYLNNAFFSVLGSAREKWDQSPDKDPLKTIHPDDLPYVKAAIEKLTNGESSLALPMRIKKDNGEWFWIYMRGSVVERKDDYIRINAASSDYNEVVKAQEESGFIRKTLEIALQSARVLAWRYDYKNRRITDSGTLGETYHLPTVVEDVPKSILDMGFIAESSRDAFINLFDEIDKEKTVSIDTEAISIDGKAPAWFRQIYTPVFDKNGRYIDAVGIAIDITEQKKKEHQYEEHQKLFKISAKDSLSCVSLNLSQNKIISFTINVPELDDKKLCKTAEELVSSIRTDEQASTEEQNKFDTISSVKNLIVAFESGQSHIEVIFHYFHNTHWVKVTYDMLRNPYTGDIEAITYLYDVTDSIRAQNVIRQLTDLDYQSLLLIDSNSGKAIPYQSEHSDSNMSDLIEIQADKNDGNLGFEEFMRKHAVPGTAEKAIKENSLDYIKERLEEAPYYVSMHSLVHNGKTDHYRVLYTYLKDDRQFIMSAVQRVTEIYDREVNQKKALSDALSAAESANKAKTAFLSRVSHDMRTPLNGILGLTALMKDAVLDANLAHDLSELELSGKYLLELINDTLDVSRIENGKLELHPEVCDSRECFNNIQNLVRPSTQEKNIQFELEADNLPFTYIYVDEGRLQQIAMNILGNAVKFTPDGGRIHVLAETLSMDNGVVTDHFVIEDNGCGMDKEFLPHLFEAFSQENATTTNSKQGTGLGMSITKSLVELMDGEIKIDSKKGVGTRVDLILKLPIATNEQIAKWQNVLNSHANDYNLHRKRVLMCEDHPLNTKIAIRLLEKKGMIVEAASNGKVGFDKFSASEEGYYDAILMDIRMPIMDGIDTAKAIRRLPRADAKKIPIIAMTANAFDNDVRQTRAAGMNAHLSKPIIPERLYGTLEHLINPTHQYIRKRVMIVDDIEANRAAIRLAIEATYEVFEAESGEQALEMLKKYNGMDLVVTDIQMPGMNGDELIRRIRANDNYRHMVIIANTQFYDSNQEEKLLSLGADDFICKPTNPNIVKIRINNALSAIK